METEIKTLPAIKYKLAYERIIASKIIAWFWETFYQECFEILENNTVYNDADIIRNAIEQGIIYYRDNAFYSTTGRFRNELAKELEALGAKYSKYRKAYLLDKSKVPVEILWGIDTVKATTALKAAAIQAYLTEQLGQLTEKVKKLMFNTAVEQIMLDLQDRVYKNAKERKIELITPKLTDFRASEIAKNYTNNLDFWIKNWTPEQMSKMRETVGQMAIDGKSTKDIAEYLKNRWGVDARHAKFLARNETAIATSSYLAAKYQDESIEYFKWGTNIDGRERPLHKQLNGQIFRFDNPPIIDERTGQRGLPGQTYNCRCVIIPVIDKDFLKRRRKLYKAHNSFVQILKGLWYNK